MHVVVSPGLRDLLVKIGPFETTGRRFSPRSGLRCIHQNRAKHTLLSQTILQSAEHAEPPELDLPHRAHGRPRRIVSTLTPSLLTESDYLDLSGAKRVRLFFPRTIDSFLDLYYEDRYFTPFPAHTHGFLYFGPQPGLPPLAASLRFRCTPTALPSSFAAGHDLLRVDGLPWQRVIAQAAMAASPVLREQLVHEGLLTEDALAKWRTRLDWAEGLKAHVVSSNLLFALHQPFPIDFGCSVNLLVVGQDRIYPLHFPHMFVDHSGGTRRRPFKGTALAHFERAPAAPHLLHLRIMRLLSPVAPSSTQESRLVLPRAGALLAVRYRGRRFKGRLSEEGHPWAVDMSADTRVAEALRVLVGGG
ncbi:hypothetical protein DFH07DRAFT_341967 [Mycena maculata]|uniref:Uncharacterized protein n=1 Tax=Mycena maculata TaxID=230809 RepID=A0AAD7MHC0_9AGAR|nr:hypothetical protein DFH07DRAFT_341967 [Mycena maculata]